MQNKIRLYRRSNRAQGTYYAENCDTGARESLGTKIRAEAEKLLQAKNDAHSQPTLSRELAKVYLQAQDPRFGKRTWGDVVENCNETCDPAEAGLERFVAMEHLEPGSLHVRSWGSVADGTTFTRRCRPGQVLFGKRRAYQRKVAVAEFEAVVSGDIYVLAPKDSACAAEVRDGGERKAMGIRRDVPSSKLTR